MRLHLNDGSNLVFLAAMPHCRVHTEKNSARDVLSSHSIEHSFLQREVPCPKPSLTPAPNFIGFTFQQSLELDAEIAILGKYGTLVRYDDRNKRDDAEHDKGQ